MVEQNSSFEIAFSLQPFRPAVLLSVMCQLGNIYEQADHFLSKGPAEIEFDADGPIDFFANYLAQLEEWSAFSELTDKLKPVFHPGQKKKSDLEKIGLAMDLQLLCQQIGPVNGFADAGEQLPGMFRIAEPSMENFPVEGKKRKKQARVYCQLKPGSSRSAVQVLEEFVTKSGRGTEGQFVAVVAQGLPGLFFDGKVYACGMADRPHHPYRVPADPFGRVADYPDYAVIEILDAAYVVNNGVVFDFVKKRVDGKIPTPGIFA